MPLLTLTDSIPVENWAGALLALGALAVALAVALFIITAVFSILFSRLDVPMKLVWIILVFLAPLIGALLWFFIGRNRAPGREFHGYR